MKAQYENLQTKFSDREQVLRALEESNRTDNLSASKRLKFLQDQNRAEMNKAQDDHRQQQQELKLKYEQNINRLKQELDSTIMVSLCFFRSFIKIICMIQIDRNFRKQISFKKESSKS